MPSNDSFINANDMNPKELASLLTMLSSNEKEYNKYMNFKKRPIPKNFEEVALMSFSHPNAACRLCAYAEHMKDSSLKSVQLYDNNNDKNNNDDNTLDMNSRISKIRKKMALHHDRARRPHQGPHDRLPHIKDND